jgi:hypothetical protein
MKKLLLACLLLFYGTAQGASVSSYDLKDNLVDADRVLVSDSESSMATKNVLFSKFKLNNFKWTEGLPYTINDTAVVHNGIFYVCIASHLSAGETEPGEGAASATAWAEISGAGTEVTIGTANGLSLAGQALSMAVASPDTTGALSGTDYETFKSKLGISELSDAINSIDITPTGSWDLSGLTSFSIVWEGATVDEYQVIPTVADPTADRALNFSDFDMAVPAASSVDTDGTILPSAVGDGFYVEDNCSTVTPAAGAICFEY